jgi:predicted amidohydrolase YtcJ
VSQWTRAEFLAKSAAAAAALGLGRVPDWENIGRAMGAARAPGTPAAGAAPHPDLVLLNGRVYTMDESLPRAEAFAVKNGRFIAVGSTADVRNLVAPGTEVVDAGGMTVTPGFVDAHSHPAWGGIEEVVNVNTDLRTVGEIQRVMRERAAKTPAGRWVVGFKYDDTKLRDGRPLTRRDLDEAVPDHPAVVGHRGGHTAVYNSRAFALAGVTAQTPSPPGGRFHVEGGELTGLVAEQATDVLDRLRPSGSTREQRRSGVKLISELMTAAGLTSVHDAGVPGDNAVAYQDAYEAGELRFRVYMLPYGRGEIFQGLKQAGLRTGFGDEWLRVGAVKFAADGSASERTMAMSTPYVGRPDDRGILTMTQDEVHAAVEDAHRHGFQVGIHANGDVAIDMVLQAYERVQARWPRPDVRHRIEHCTLVSPELLRRIKAVGAIPTPFWTYAHYHGEKWAQYGDDKLRWMFAHRSFLDHGIPVAGASDYIPGPFEPLMAIQSMVTRKDMRGHVWGPNQRVTVSEALRIATVNGARASHEEELKGSIVAGKLADFVILAADPHDAEPDRIKEIGVIRTVVGGRTMHPKGAT